MLNMWEYPVPLLLLAGEIFSYVSMLEGIQLFRISSFTLVLPYSTFGKRPNSFASKPSWYHHKIFAYLWSMESQHKQHSEITSSIFHLIFTLTHKYNFQPFGSSLCINVAVIPSIYCIVLSSDNVVKTLL